MISINNGLERKKFEAQWSRLRVEYAARGMDETTITALYEFDCQTFNSNRRYAEHTQAISHQTFSDDGDEVSEDRSALLAKFLDAFTMQGSHTHRMNDNGWIDEIGDRRLWKGLSKLSDKDKELLTLYIFDEHTMVEIAKMRGVSQAAISKRLLWIKNFLKKYR